MVQSDLDGGSLHAARAALKYDRWLAVPCPIKRDLQNQEKVVRANLLLTQGAEEEVAKLLNCDLERLEKLNVLKSRDDYHNLIKLPQTNSAEISQGTQGVLPL